MKKTLFIFVISMSISSIAQQATTSSGGNGIGVGGSTSYSIGQVAYMTQTGSTGSMTQGVQQAYEIFTLGVNNFPEIKLSMSVYPNPTISNITLKVEDLSLNDLKIELFDTNGRQIQSRKVQSTNTFIDLENLPSSTYILKVESENKTIKTFKIIKN
ncbi:T9SS type A sorting domain-containing protein [Flavobacterium sp.]|uniref:T9SS type A sorting domain-containing protein n=1 Tax=Flavobacterium sp. TaxID=239 RepID=UPI0038FCF23F